MTLESHKLLESFNVVGDTRELIWVLFVNFINK